MSYKPCAICVMPTDLAVCITHRLLTGESPRRLAGIYNVPRHVLKYHITACYSAYLARQEKREKGGEPAEATVHGK